MLHTTLKDGTNHGLKVDLGVPVGVKENDNVSCSQVDSQASGTSTQHEDKLGALWCVEFQDGFLYNIAS